MTPFAIATAGLQSLSSWVMSILALLALLVFAIVCLVVVELALERRDLAQAYTVKCSSSEDSTTSAAPADEI